MLLVHEAAGFRERGVSVSLSYNPTPSTPLGLTARVAPSWGGAGHGRSRGAVERRASGGAGGVRPAHIGRAPGCGRRLRPSHRPPLRGNTAVRLREFRVRTGPPGRLRPQRTRARHARPRTRHRCRAAGNADLPEPRRRRRRAKPRPRTGHRPLVATRTPAGLRRAARGRPRGHPPAAGHALLGITTTHDRPRSPILSWRQAPGTTRYRVSSRNLAHACDTIH